MLRNINELENVGLDFASDGSGTPKSQNFISLKTRKLLKTQPELIFDITNFGSTQY